MKILGLFPLTGNGGIASWTKKFLATFPDEEYQIRAVNISPSVARSGGKENLLHRIKTGLVAETRILKEVKNAFKTEHFDILHTTTSGNLGSYRDIKVAKLCKKYGVKSIMHCRYGCITEDIRFNRLIGILLRKSLSLFDQIWVLDTRTYNTLKAIPWLSHKIHLTPNSVDVVEPYDASPKDYSRIAFVGNMIPTKGLYELVVACTKTKVQLDIIGPGSDTVVARIMELAGESLNNTIFIHGKLTNAEAVRFMQEVDIVALPTYYEAEAFPMSIIEAMSLSKMVISCPRAAVKDMLTDLDGHPCGMLVAPKSVDAIVSAIEWLQSHKLEANEMCKKAYEKVYTCYRKEVVYELYRALYKELV